jgi:hypothetical protein
MTPANKGRFIAIRRGSPTKRRYRMCCAMLLVSFSICFCLSACHRAPRQTSPTSTAKPILSAEPNPIPAGDPNQQVGTTVIRWDTGNGTIGYLYVKVDRQPEKFVTRGPSGTYEVPWIQFDSVYEFRLYDKKKRSKLLAKLEVTRDD